jgi:hypothetical protein
MSCRPILALATSLLVSAPALAQDPRTDQEVGEGVVRDHGYLFELAQPGDTWRLLPEADARQLSPDAVAGVAATHQPLHAAVIVEQAQGANARAMAQILLGNLPLEEKEAERFEAVTLAGIPAIRFAVRGRFNGSGVRYVNTVVVHRDHTYQLVCWGPLNALDAKGEAVEAVWEAFRFLAGDVAPGRAPPPGAEELAGVGWRVRGGHFASAAHGLSVKRPPQGWRLSLGDELRQLNDTAEVGLVCADPELYLVVIPERAAGVDLDALEANLRERVAYDLGPPKREFGAQLGGESLRLTFHALGGNLPTDFVHGVVRRGQRVYQVLAWWLSSNNKAARAALPTGLGLIGFLSAAKQAELTKELAYTVESQNTIGRTHVLRRGTYRDFALGFTWAPPEGFWRISAGQAARAVNPAAQLFVEEPALGLSGLVIVEESAEPIEEDELHALALQSLLGPAPAPQRPLRRSVGQVTFRVSWLDLEEGGTQLRYLVATAKKGQRLFQLHCWGLPGNMRASEERVWGVLEGLRVEAGRIRPLERRGTALSDQRIGIRFAPPGDGWTLRPLSQPVLEAAGAGYQWLRPGEGVTLIAMCSTAPEQDAAWFERFVGQLILDRLTREQGIEFGEPTDCQVQGRPGSLRKGVETDGGGRVDIATFHRDRTFYALLITDEAGNGVGMGEVLQGLGARGQGVSGSSRAGGVWELAGRGCLGARGQGVSGSSRAGGVWELALQMWLWGASPPTSPRLSRHLCTSAQTVAGGVRVPGDGAEAHLWRDPPVKAGFAVAVTC